MPRLDALSLIAVLLFSMLSAPMALGAQAAGAADERFVIRGARVFDGERSRGAMDVLVRDGRIAALGIGLQVPSGTMEVDGRGKTLLPGLIDSHTHVYGDALRTALAFGVTTELDQFTDVAMARSVKERQAKGGLADVADLFSAGTLVTSPKGHGTEYGMVIPTISTPQEAQPFVDARLAEGSEWIKIVYDNGRAYGLTIPTIDRATLKAVVDAAHARGKLAVVHIGDQQAAREAIEAGADGLVHLFVDRAPDADLAQLVGRHHAFVIPTLTVSESVTGSASGTSLVADAALARWIDPAAAANLQRGFSKRPGSMARYAFTEDATLALHAARVPLLAGTDAPNPGTWQGVSMHRELELLVHAGLTPIEALTAATSAPAKYFRLTDRGRIAPGLRADLLLVSGDPVANILATREVVSVWKRGVRMDRDAYRIWVSQQRASTTEAPREAQDGLVSDFEQDQPMARLGSGWVVTTDQFIGGKSVGTIRVAPDGAAGSAKSLLVEGTVNAGSIATWSGAMLLTGKTPMQPADFSARKTLRFWARGDGKTYSVMLFSQRHGPQPMTRTFTAGAEWKEFVFALADFDGFDGKDLQGLAFTSASAPGSFEFRLDDVRLK